MQIYQLPRINDQFKFEAALKDIINNPYLAYDIDKLNGWQIKIIVDSAVNNKDVRTLTFCSKNNGNLYAIAVMFLHGKLWFVDSSKKNKLTEHIDDMNFLTVSRY